MIFDKKKYDPFVTLEGYKLEYRGSGTRKALIFDLYAAVLYSNDVFISTQDAIEKDVPKVLVTNILTPLLNGSILSQVFKDALSRTHFGKEKDIQQDIENIIQLFKRGKIARFDKFDFLYAPDKGFVAYQNGIKSYSCKNPILAKAVFEVYLGSYHKDQVLPRKIAGL